SLAQVHDEINAAGQPQPLVIPFDLQSADPAHYQALATMIERTVGRLFG
ncbi:putative oxoacyl-(acyl carrier protein) reductase, partial [Pseudomonas syringae pv. pisi str. 1704B]